MASEDDYDYFEVLERYKYLKNTELPDIPDVILEHAVMSWMWTKSSNERQYEIISSLPKPCQNVYSCRTVTDEINNGGLNQLFYNDTGQFAEMSIEGFLALGSPKLSEVMAKAVELYQEKKSVLDEYNDDTLESFFASYKEKIFEKLDSDFYDECDSVEMAKYIRQNADCFGD